MFNSPTEARPTHLSRSDLDILEKWAIRGTSSRISWYPTILMDDADLKIEYITKIIKDKFRWILETIKSKNKSKNEWKVSGNFARFMWGVGLKLATQNKPLEVDINWLRSLFAEYDIKTDSISDTEILEMCDTIHQLISLWLILDKMWIFYVDKLIKYVESDVAIDASKAELLVQEYRTEIFEVFESIWK